MNARTTRVAAGVALVAAPAAAFALALTDAAQARKHRLRVPPTTYHSMSVNETEWAVRPGHNALAAGKVKFHVYNVGMDDHDLTIATEAGAVVARAPLVKALAEGKPGESILTPTLARGRYKLYCSYFADSPDSHEVAGMVAWIRVV